MSGNILRSEVLEIVREEMESLKSRIIANHEAAKQVASGRTKASLHVEVTDKEAVLWGRFPFGTLETGRKPGNAPKGFVEIIRQWAVDKGIRVSPIPYVRRPSERWQPKYTPEERGMMSFAGAVAHKIVSEGTLLYRNGGNGGEIYSKEIAHTVEEIQNRVGRMFSLEVEHINLNS